jgi:serine/threonine protein kinase
VGCKLLGSGIYGNVFLANDVATQTQLACKIVDLRRNALNQKECTPTVHEDVKPRVQAYAEKINKVVEVRRKLVREIEILSKLSHV